MLAVGKATLILLLLLAVSQAASAEPYQIQTVFGSSLPVSGPALTASLPLIHAMTVDKAGNLYLQTGAIVFKIDPSGNLTRVLGNGTAGYSGDGGPGPAAQFEGVNSAGIAVDGAGNVFVAHSGRIRRVDARTGITTTIAGRAGVCGVDEGPALSVELRQEGLAADDAGNLFFVVNDKIKRYDAASGWISNVAQLEQSEAIVHYVAVDQRGNIYVTDGNVIRRIDAQTGRATVVAGGGVGSHLGDGGPATEAAIYPLHGIALDGQGNLYFQDRSIYVQQGVVNRIRKVDRATGIITSVLDNTGSPVEALGVIAVDANGQVYFAGENSAFIFKVDHSGAITKIAGNRTTPAGDGGPVVGATAGVLSHVHVDAAGNVYLSEGMSHRVRKIDASTGVITTVAGNGTAGFSGDNGPAILAQLSWPRGLAVDAGGNLYIADNGNNRVRRVDAATGIITTIAGRSQGWAGDGGRATDAQLYTPVDVALGSGGALFIAEYGGYIHAVDSAGVISTLLQRPGGFHPVSMAADSSGNLFISDSLNDVLWKLDVSTKALTRITSGTSFGELALDAAGNLYVSAAGAGRILKLDPSSGAEPALVVEFWMPGDLAFSPAGQLYVIESGTSLLWVVTATGGSSKCDVRLSSTSIAAPDTGGTFTTRVTAGDPGCYWRVRGQPGWLTAFPSSGFGSQDVKLVVNGNLDPPRKATIKIVDASVDVTQDRSLPAVLAARKFHSENVWQGTSVDYTVYVCNGGGATTGPVTLTEILPAGLSLKSIDAWFGTCSAGACSSDRPLVFNETWNLRVRASAAADAPTQVTNTVAVSTGGSVVATASDTVAINRLTAPVLHYPLNQATAVEYDPRLRWKPAEPADYELYLGESPTPPRRAICFACSELPVPGLLKPLTTYYWRVVAKLGGVAASSETWSFTTLGGKIWVAQKGIVQSARYQPGYSPGDWVSIFGQFLASTTRTWRSDEIVNGQFPTQLDDVSVIYGDKPIAISYISPTQLNVQVTNPGTCGPNSYFTITNSFGRIVWSSPCDTFAPSFFMYDPAGRKYIAAQHADLSILGPPGLFPNATSSPAKPGEVIVLYGGGFGPTTPETPSGQIVTAPAPLANLKNLSIRIGGVPAQVQWAGMTMAGLWQINVKVPDGLPDGDAAVVADMWGYRSQDNAFITIRQ